MPDKKKIVVIDDEQGVTELLQKVFTMDGYIVRTENYSEKGLELVKNEKPDIVLLDIKMPNIDGIEVLSRIKETEKDVIVIMITGYGSLETAMESMKSGAFDYITKPFDINFIKELVARSLESKKG